MKTKTDQNKIWCLTKASLAALVVAALAACGGGGGGGDSPAPSPAPTPAPAPAPIEPAAVPSVPAATYTDGKKVAAFNRLNEMRSAAGLGLLAQNGMVDAAAQSHSDYQARNNVLSHGETAGQAGFTGATAAERVAAAGYAADAASEVITSDAASDGAGLIDQLASMPYHRLALLNYSPTDAGFGYAGFPTNAAFAAMTVDMARRSGVAQGAPSTPFAIWPSDGATGVGTSMWPEVPNPIPENGTLPAGFTVSIHVNEMLRTLDVTSFTLVDASGTAVPVKLLTRTTDTFLAASNISYFVAILPRSPLTPNAAYTATFVGSYAYTNGTGSTQVSKTWTFTTGAN